MKIKEQREKDGKRLGKLKTWEVSVQDIDRQFSKKRRNTQAEKIYVKWKRWNGKMNIRKSGK